MAGVRFESVTKRFDDTTAILDLSLVVQDREFLVLVGPSGCGKSTFLRLLAGLEDATEGRILVGDRIVNNLPPGERNVSMVFQSYALYPHMSVFDNMAFGLRMRKVPRDEIGSRVKEAARLLEIEGLLGRRPRQLSGGQRQRVALGRAIVREPAAFLLDEPLSNLDARLRAQTRAELIKLHGRLGTTFIYVTHDQVEAMTMAGRIAVMDQGVLQQVGTPGELYERPANLFVAGFLGSPPMNLVEVSVAGSDRELSLETEGLRLRVPPWKADALLPFQGRKVILGIRPEDICPRGDCTPGPDTAAAVGEVVLTEIMGREKQITLQCGSLKFLMRMFGPKAVRPGERIEIFFDMAGMRAFDPGRGNAIAGTD
jgi:multiple sugar transport system ATP-binding protein